MRQVFSEEGLLDAGMEIVQREGYEAVTMRSVADAARSSVQPLYSIFGDRESYMKALYDRAVEWVRAYNAEHSDEGRSAFSSVGVAHIRIAQNHPGIFSFVYMSPYVRARNMTELLLLAEQPGVLAQMESMWGLTSDQAKALYSNLAIYTHGLSTLIMAGAEFSDEELQAGMNEVFYALASLYGADLPGECDA